ncbi:MAG: 5-oxoprolinase subunit B family protein [Rubrimonas sp.]
MTAPSRADPAARVLPLGDAAFTLSLPDEPGPQTTARLAAAAARLAQAPGVVDVAPSFRTLTVHFDPMIADPAALAALALAESAAADPAPGETADWRIPVCFDADLGPDQDEVAAETGLTPAQAVEMLVETPLTVLAVGFLPGFPFCGMAPPPLRLKRKASPRLRVPAGSVAVANGFAGIYPWVSPGGWRILGNTAVPLFRPDRPRPAVLAPGDPRRVGAVVSAAPEARGADPAGPNDRFRA